MSFTDTIDNSNTIRQFSYKARNYNVYHIHNLINQGKIKGQIYFNLSLYTIYCGTTPIKVSPIGLFVPLPLPVPVCAPLHTLARCPCYCLRW